ncbi:MAG TPA: TraB/GumN family protein, partial [Phenylobacterium sp.]|nr:TraB/GumN family protein [Phenylobacterium sp.]
LRQKLLPSEIAALGPLLASQKLDLGEVDHLRPWVTALTLSVTPMLDRGYKVESGVDTAVARATHASPKRLRTFESLERQAQMFAAMPEPVELQYLADVIKERTEPSAGAPMQKAWAAGDLAALGEGLLAVMKTTRPQFYDLFLKDRNQAWAETLGAEMASGEGVQLVNVGALHMLGEDGLPALMRARGYTVTRIQ